MKLLVTDNLVSDLSQLDSFNINLEKISIKDISNQAQSLFDDDKFKFIFDEFITISSFNKLKIDLDDNYIFQIKKSNLSKFTSLGSEVDVLYLDSQKKENYFPWDLTNLIYSSRKTIDLKLLDSFTSNERDFRNFLSYFIKELIRLKMLSEFDPNEVAETLKEKKDYKYNDALKKIKNLDQKKINRAIQYSHKIEKSINQYGYEIENSGLELSLRVQASWAALVSKAEIIFRAAASKTAPIRFSRRMERNSNSISNDTLVPPCSSVSSDQRLCIWRNGPDC
mgnify:CR=1 FL=1